MKIKNSFIKLSLYALCTIFFFSLFTCLTQKKSGKTKKKFSKEIYLDKPFLGGFISPDTGIAVGWKVFWESEKSASKYILKVEKEGENWAMTEPRRNIADSLEAEANTRNFFSLTPFAFFKQTNQFKPSGNHYSLFFQRKDSKQMQTFHFVEGNRFPALEAFAIRYENQFFLVKEWFIFALRKRPGELYPQNFLKLAPEEIYRVQGRDFLIKKKSHLRWELDGIAQRSISQKKIDLFLQAIGNLKAREAIVDRKKQLTLKKKQIFQLDIEKNIDTNHHSKVKKIMLTFYEDAEGNLYTEQTNDSLLYLLPSNTLRMLDLALKDFKK